MSRFGDALRQLRLGAGITLGDLAKHLDTQPAMICHYEFGRRLPSSISVVEKIISFLKLSSNNAMLLRISLFIDKRKVEIDVDDNDYAKNELVIAFSRKVNTLDDIDIKKILSILNDKSDGDDQDDS